MQGIPIRSRQILDELVDQLPWLLGDDIGLLLERLEAQLDDNPVSIFEQPECCRESQRTLLYRRASVQPAMVEALRRRCLALGEAPGAATIDSPAPARQAQSLRLMDDEAVSEDSMLAAVARRHASGASLHLMLLGQRFGVLYARPALSPEALPVGPFAFGQRRAADALGPEAALPAGMQAERREALMAVARFLMRHGRDSSQWGECLATADALLEAARASGGAPEQATTWLRKAITAVGYGEGDATRLAAGLTTPAQDDGNAPVERQRGVREQRCFDRLVAMAPGATIAFSSGTGGFLHARVCEHLPDPARLLLCVDDGPEIMLEVDMVARLMAAGEAWTVRQPGAAMGGAQA